MSASNLSSIRPSLRDQHRASSNSPHTPSRFIPSSTYSSPGGTSFRNEDDAIIIELDPRFLLAGFEGESSPHCLVRFTPSGCRRVGDFREFIPGARKRKIADNLGTWSTGYELWRNDLMDFDLGLMEDKLERVVREVYNTHLLTDAGSARLVLVMPSLVPHPVLDSVLTLLFERWRYSSITLLPRPTMVVVGAGLRAGLVVDVGWEETVVTSVYEYRELASFRTVRGMRSLVRNVGEKLWTIREGLEETLKKELRFDFDFVEEFVGKVFADHALDDDHCNGGDDGKPKSNDKSDSQIELDWPTANSSRIVNISTKMCREISTTTFLGNKGDIYADDHEQSISQNVYKALLHLPPDVRAICMSRMIFTGPGGHIYSLDKQVMNEVKVLVTKHGWSAVRGEKKIPNGSGKIEMAFNRSASADARAVVSPSADDDPVELDLRRTRGPSKRETVQGNFRQVSSLGAWAGASLLTSLKVKSVVEIEKDRFLSHGISGAQRESDLTSIPQRMSGLALGGAKSHERANWTLAGWG